MPDRRHHRGPHPEDARWFAPALWPVLREATADLCWLLSRDYPSKSALKLVGDRYDLVVRQRTAVGRSACSSAKAARRKDRQVGRRELAGQPLWVDGYNVLTTVEAAMARGVLLAGCDGTYRDMASMHGSFRKVAETLPALETLGRATAELRVEQCVWYLDRPVSNSGRLKGLIEELSTARGWPWRVELVPDPDAILAAARQIVATADSAILDACGAWFNLARETVAGYVPEATVIEMIPSGSRCHTPP
ncbi:MAG: hypothetical protein A2V70_14455 [Planctomycetes bacterium RBG_13_63_9]|nr:MAG: hypothetical protein A2V70_14455 [Planctomycetes bacterium RBG_13_63_9]